MREILVPSYSYLEVLWEIHTGHDPYSFKVVLLTIFITFIVISLMVTLSFALEYDLE